MTDSAAPRLNRVQRVLAMMVATVAVISLVSMIASIAIAGSGNSVWPIVLVLPLVGFPIAFLLIIGLLVASVVRRARESRDA